MSKGAIHIAFFKQLNNTPALALAMRAWADVEERGLGDGSMTVYSNLNAMVGYAQNGRDMLPVGVITFEHQEHAGKIWIYSGFVLPEFRGRGIYRAMWNELVLKAMDLKAAKIEGATHMRNASMRAVAKKLERTESYVVLSFDVPADQ